MLDLWQARTSAPAPINAGVIGGFTATWAAGGWSASVVRRSDSKTKAPVRDANRGFLPSPGPVQAPAEVIN
jgi:hypothetical protein